MHKSINSRKYKYIEAQTKERLNTKAITKEHFNTKTITKEH